MIYRATLNLFNRSIIYLHYHLWIINAPSRDLSAENKSKRNQTCLEYHTLLIAAAWANIVLQKATLSNVWMLNSCETKTIWSHITAPITEKIQIFFIGLQYTNNAEQALYFDGAQLPWCKKSTEIVIYTTMFQWIQNGPHFLFLIRSLQSLADSFSWILSCRRILKTHNHYCAISRQLTTEQKKLIISREKLTCPREPFHVPLNTRGS